MTRTHGQEHPTIPVCFLLLEAMEKGRYDRLSADDEEPFLSREAIHRVDFRRRRSLWKILPHVISILTIAVCGSLVGWKFMAKVTEHDILDPQSFFPKCKSTYMYDQDSI